LEELQYEAAAASFQRAREQDISDGRLGLLEAVALVGVEGFSVGLTVFERALKEASKPIDQGSLLTTLGLILMAEVKQRGAAAMAKQMHLLRDLLAKHEATDALPGALTTLGKALLSDEQLVKDDWASVMPILQEALANIPECAMPLEMLSVISRYKKTG